MGVEEYIYTLLSYFMHLNFINLFIQNQILKYIIFLFFVLLFREKNSCS